MAKPVASEMVNARTGQWIPDIVDKGTLSPANFGMIETAHRVGKIQSGPRSH